MSLRTYSFHYLNEDVAWLMVPKGAMFVTVTSDGNGFRLRYSV